MQIRTALKGKFIMYPDNLDPLIQQLELNEDSPIPENITDDELLNLIKAIEDQNDLDALSTRLIQKGRENKIQEHDTNLLIADATHKIISNSKNKDLAFIQKWQDHKTQYMTTMKNPVKSNDNVESSSTNDNQMQATDVTNKPTIPPIVVAPVAVTPVAVTPVAVTPVAAVVVATPTKTKSSLSASAPAPDTEPMFLGDIDPLETTATLYKNNKSDAKTIEEIQAKLDETVQSTQKAIDTYLANILKNNKNKRKDVMSLILTLKHYANPLGMYPADPNCSAKLKDVFNKLEEQATQASKDQRMSTKTAYLRTLTRLTLDSLATKAMTEANQYFAKQKPITKTISNEDIYQAVNDHFLSQSQPSAPNLSDNENDENTNTSKQTPTPTPEEIWWNGLNDEAKQKIRARAASINKNQDQKKHLDERIKYVYINPPSITIINLVPDYDYLYAPYYYQMMLDDNALNYIRIRNSRTFNIDFLLFDIWLRLSILSDISRIAGNLGHGAIHHTGRAAKHLDGETQTKLGAILAFVALGLAAIVASIYALKKTYNSLRNILVRQEKILRSIFRLSSMTGGALGGFFWGLSYGATLGSALPGLGTAGGAILGGLFGAGLGAGIGAIVAKYVAKGLSKWIYNDTNPDKWTLSKTQETNLESIGADVNAIKARMQEIRAEKRNTVEYIAGSIPGTQSREKKNELNAELRLIKNAAKLDKKYPRPYGLFHNNHPTQMPTIRTTTVVSRALFKS